MGHGYVMGVVMDTPKVELKLTLLLPSILNKFMVAASVFQCGGAVLRLNCEKGSLGRRLCEGTDIILSRDAVQPDLPPLPLCYQGVIGVELVHYVGDE